MRKEQEGSRQLALRPTGASRGMLSVSIGPSGRQAMPMGSQGFRQGWSLPQDLEDHSTRRDSEEKLFTPVPKLRILEGLKVPAPLPQAGFRNSLGKFSVFPLVACRSRSCLPGKREVITSSTSENLVKPTRSDGEISDVVSV